MSESSDTWQVLSYLNKCKEQILGFDYRVQSSPDGRPIAIMWMTPTMRTNLLRYYHILFLDCQKRQTNKIAWPYIGPSVLNSENKVAVCCEAMVTAEDIDTYTWVLKSMVEIEHRWSLKCIDIIYADCFITDSLLTNLGIKQTCCLHGDYYHLFREVWPKLENFGRLFVLVKNHLAKMLKSVTIDEWNISFAMASKLLSNRPDKLQLLNDIYSKPEYYAGYYIRKIQHH